MYRIEINELPPSLNKFYSGMHWAKRKQLVDYWHRQFWLAFKVAKIPVITNFPITLTITQFCKGIVRDADNGVISAKMIGDSLKEFGYIPDDNPKYIGTVVLRSKKGKSNKIVAVIAYSNLG